MKKLLCMLLLLIPVAASAGMTGLSLEEKTEAEKQRALERIGFVIWTEDYSDWAIECFDVREDGMIALGFSRSSDSKYVAVLDADGVFQYGCTFRYSAAFLVDWVENELGIILLRSNLIGVFDETGDCIAMRTVKKTDSAFNRYKNALQKPTRSVDGVTYVLRNDHFLSWLSTDYCKLVRIDAQGNERVLHEASGAAFAGAAGVFAIIVLIGVCLFVHLQKSDQGRIDNPLNS